MNEYSILDEETQPDSLAIIEAYIVTKPKIERYEKIGCSISGGSDSDIIIDMISKLDSDKKVKYVFFNTGIEYEATKRHIEFLSQKYRPIFWLKQEDKEEYERHFNVQHSDCYTKYGLKRTGCAGCPFGKNFEYELEIMKKYEPKLYKAALHIFGASYEYTRAYKKFVKDKEKEKRGYEQLNLFE